MRDNCNEDSVSLTCSSSVEQLSSVLDRTAKKPRRAPLLALALLLVVGTVASDQVEGVPLAERGIWIGAYSPPSPWESMAAVHGLEQAIDRRVDVVHLYKAWGEPWGQYNAETIRELVSVTADGRRALITWEPWVLSKGVQQPDFALAGIAAGEHDVYIRSWAEGLREFPGVIYLRPMHEMNGNWYPWAGGIEGNRSTDYIAAWRHMYDVFDQVGASNVRWVWSPYAMDVPSSHTFEAYYPGDEYVDILAFDAYNWGTGGDGPAVQSTGRWQEVDDLLMDPYRRLARIGPQPVWLVEVSSAEQGGDKANWLRTLLGSRDYIRISAVIWFDVDKERDWRITSSASAAAAVAKALVGIHPADESEVAPARPVRVLAHGMRHAARLEWGGASQIEGLSYEVMIYTAGGLVRRDVTKSAGLYIVPDLDAGTSYTFTVRALSRFGSSPRSTETPPVTIIG